MVIASTMTEAIAPPDTDTATKSSKLIAPATPNSVARPFATKASHVAAMMLNPSAASTFCPKTVSRRVEILNSPV